MKSDAEILTIIEHEERNALGYMQGELSAERADALEYYEREPRGDEVEGQSAVISSDVADTVDWALPDLIKIFTASDKAVEFEPEGPEDEQAAKQATQAVNYVFYRQNQGFLVMHSWFKDALIQKNGYVKYWWDKSTTTRKQKYRGLTDEQLVMLLQSDEVKVLAHTAEVSADGVTIHDVDLEITQEKGKVRIEAVPPEEILVNRDHRNLELQSARFVAHRARKTVSDLREMGYPEDKIRQVGDGDDDLAESAESIARDSLDEERQLNDVSGDASTKSVWVTEAYILIDEDGDGVAERRKIVKAGKVIFEDEECERVCISALTPKIRPHKHIGDSVAEDAMDIQDVNTGLLRGTLNNLYLTNAPRMKVLSSRDGTPLANLDDLLTVRVNGIVREYAPDAVTPLVVPYVGQYSMQMMEYMDQKRMNRTGVNNLSSGLDADAINKTARGAVIADNKQQIRIELIARVFAETGVKDMFQGILYLLCTYSDRPLMMRLRNEYVTMDPREWNHLMDMTINVGLGTGNKDQQLAHLQTIGQMQTLMIQGGFMNRLVTEKNVYNMAAKTVENAGFKAVEDFFTDPEKAGPPPPPQPDPEMQKAQMEAQLKEKELAQKAQSDEMSSFLEIQKAQIDAAVKRFTAELDAQTELQKAQIQIQAQERMKVMEVAANREAQQNEAQNRYVTEGIKVNAQERMAETSRKDKIDEVGNAKAVEKLESVVNNLSEGMNNLAQVMSRPKKIIRGKDGRATGVE